MLSSRSPAKAVKSHAHVSDVASGRQFPKVLSGIRGLDEITDGGLPRGRPILVCGGAGCGKTIFATEFLVRGATEFGEPGVFMAFEETAEELASNVYSLGFDLEKLQGQRKLSVDFVRVERSEIEETGEYDLEGLFVRLQLAVETVGAKRVVLDTIESLFASLPNALILRSELRRLFRWFKDRELTVVITGERGEGTHTRQGLEEYVSDCVIFLDHRVVEQNSTRRLRIVKYRGSIHGTNEYPFVIDERGISILPITSLGLTHKAYYQRISSGIAHLDVMLGGEGYYKGSTVLVTGSAGTGKTSIAAIFAHAACLRGEKCLYFAYEESTEQLIRNMCSIGVQLEPLVNVGLLSVSPSRPTAHGLEKHLISVHKAVDQFNPDLVVVDPITSLNTVGSGSETQLMLIRVIDYLKMRGTTTLFTGLTGNEDNATRSEEGISSLIDTWLFLRMVQSSVERRRELCIVKSRGMVHSNRIVEYRFSNEGLNLDAAALGAAAEYPATDLLTTNVAEATDRNQRKAAKRKSVLKSQTGPSVDENRGQLNYERRR